MRARIRDTELFFDVDGAGLVIDGAQMRQRPVAFLLHGGPGADHTSYKPAFESLTQQMQLVYIDHRGQGRSARSNPETYTLDNNVEDLEALREYLGLEQIVVIGGSYGGMVGLTYASRYPDRVAKLIVYATAGSHQFLPRAQAILRERGTPEQQTIAQFLWDGNFQSEAQLNAYFQQLGPLYSLTFKPEQASQAWQRTRLSIDAINQAFGGFLRTYNVMPQLKHITAPSLVIGGRHDWICAPEFSAEIAAAIPQAELMIFEQSGHSIRSDQLEDLLNAIRQFVGNTTVDD
ncbi:alpha/beta hydrolase [filamentous cyanobacterium LEGE 11480]|uniref:Alpha/beta hydrolase n=1 Tax=Romeriopsis navalis LEGE 11480 TaxID=2777977 RepID=A0A928Z3H9_9CYAN|nr:alpha/beta hydrolase [Romeriopsis navalis]MBE9030694.1 alpha/beta hydrolase [Romeriopsis navalis LEGE 11480]